MELVVREMTEKDMEVLARAKSILENPSLAAKLMDSLGAPVEKGYSFLPEKWQEQVEGITEKALTLALQVAITTIDNKSESKSSDFLHKVMAAAAGGAGGFLGLPALAVELPVSTSIIMRSIADIARSEGEELDSIETKLACLEVFAFGGESADDDKVDTAYFAVRAALGKTIADAARHMAEKGAARETAPALVRLIAQIATRFGVVVSEKTAAAAVPVVGAAGGAIINTIFMDHYQDMARGHFAVRRLERELGAELIRTQYEKIECDG